MCLQGQLGIGSIKKGAGKGNEDMQTKPVKCLVERCTAVAAGLDFSMCVVLAVLLPESMC